MGFSKRRTGLRRPRQAHSQQNLRVQIQLRLQVGKEKSETCAGSFVLRTQPADVGSSIVLDAVMMTSVTKTYFSDDGGSPFIV